MVGSNQNCIKFFKIQAGAQLKPFFGGFETRLNSLNSETELKENSFYEWSCFWSRKYLVCYYLKTTNEKTKTILM